MFLLAPANFVARLRVTILGRLHSRLPIRVTIVLIDPGVDVGIRKMGHVVLQMCALTLKDDMFVDFVVTRVGIANVNSFVTTKLVPEKPEVPTRVITAMSNPATEEHEAAIDVESVGQRGTNGLL